MVSISHSDPSAGNFPSIIRPRSHMDHSLTCQVAVRPVRMVKTRDKCLRHHQLHERLPTDAAPLPTISRNPIDSLPSAVQRLSADLLWICWSCWPCLVPPAGCVWSDPVAHNRKGVTVAGIDQSWIIRIQGPAADPIARVSL